MAEGWRTDNTVRRLERTPRGLHSDGIHGLTDRIPSLTDLALRMIAARRLPLARQLLAKLQQHLLAFRPWAKAGGAVDMAGIADDDEAAAPRLREKLRARRGDVFVVRTGDDDAGERELRVRELIETPPLRRIVPCLYVAWCDEERS